MATQKAKKPKSSTQSESVSKDSASKSQKSKSRSKKELTIGGVKDGAVIVKYTVKYLATDMHQSNHAGKARIFVNLSNGHGTPFNPDDTSFSLSEG